MRLTLRSFYRKSRSRGVIFSFSLGIFLTAAIPTHAQQLTCTPSVSQAVCKEFDASFGAASVWSKASSLKRVQIVITDPVEFKAEQERLKDETDAAVKARRTAGDLNRAGGRQAGRGVFTYEILESPASMMITRIVISTEAIDGSPEVSTPAEISSQLKFYVAGYAQGFEQGIAGMVP